MLLDEGFTAMTTQFSLWSRFKWNDETWILFQWKLNVSDSTNTATGPIFVAPVGNQTAAIGREVVFSCSVRNISIRKYKVMTSEMVSTNKRATRIKMRTHFPRIWWHFIP